MNKTQRVTLWILLVLELAMLLYPPYEVARGYRRFFLGHHWLFSVASARIDFVSLAAQVVTVFVIGFTVCLLARGISDEQFDALIAPGSSQFQKLVTGFWIGYILVPIFTGLLAYGWLPNESFDESRDEMIASHEVCQADSGPCGDRADIWKDKITGTVYTYEQFAPHRQSESVRMMLSWFGYGLIGCMVLAWTAARENRLRFLVVFRNSLLVNLALALWTFADIRWN